MPPSFSPIPTLARITRRLQARHPQRPLKGLTRLANTLDRWLPAYAGPVRFPDGTRMHLDSRNPAERWLIFSGDYQPALTHLLSQHTPRGGYALDVGANLGFYTLKFAQWTGPDGRVAAFEANPALAQRLEEQVTLNDFAHVAVVAQPVHSQAETLTFYISASPGKSSIHSAHVAAPTETLTLQAITLDAYLHQHDWPRLDVVKMDIEGNDCNALLGARETLARFRPVIVFEYWFSTPDTITQQVFD
ncbi:MAG: FkbM family methyltransferase, partial [Chloroflexi bacterium]|nr:FkbM family methyltransferase [Chloroflexota bacterium]